jgi:sRNA-binding regulator protein Hfq
LETSRINRVAVYLLNGLPLKKRVLNSNYCTAVLKNGSGENVRKTVLIGVFFPLWQADM